MASNLGVQYAAGITVPGCQQFRRNLMTKAHKTTIIGMAAINPAAAMHCEAGSVLVTIPRHLHGNYSASTKRNKTMVAAYPSIEVIPGIPIQTEGKLENHSHEVLKLDDKIFWEGSRPVKLDKEIKAGGTSTFTQKAGSGGSIGALEYVFPEDKFKWIIAWSNAKDDLNKVYTEILREDADWTEIRESLDKSGQESIFNGIEHGMPYSSKVEIDKTSPEPKMTATLVRGGIYRRLAAISEEDDALGINAVNKSAGFNVKTGDNNAGVDVKTGDNSAGVKVNTVDTA